MRALTLTLVLTTGLITIFILVISVIGKWSRLVLRAPTLTFILDTLTHLLVQAGEQCVQYKGKC